MIRSVVVAVLLAAAPAPAATVPADKPAVLARWTQPTAGSLREWREARRDRAGWRAYGFVWTTDLCSGAPERPAGFDFREACARHDFGYRNYRAAGALAAHRDRLDRAFRADMVRVCDRRRPLVRPFCVALAWTYFGAVRRRN